MGKSSQDNRANQLNLQSAIYADERCFPKTPPRSRVAAATSRSWLLFEASEHEAGVLSAEAKTV